MRASGKGAVLTVVASLCCIWAAPAAQNPPTAAPATMLPARNLPGLRSTPVRSVLVSDQPVSQMRSSKTTALGSPSSQSDQSFPLSQRLLIAVLPAVLTGLLSWAVSRWQAKREIQKIHEQIEAQYNAERRTRAGEVLDMLFFHADLLRAQMDAVKGMLVDQQGKAAKLQGWFSDIKAECAKGTALDAANFSARCHYDLVFAMTTLYYTAIYFAYAQEMRRLMPFTRLTGPQQAKLESHVIGVRDAFARTESDRLAEERGLWIPVQDNMGGSVRKDGSHKSYTEFCRSFTNMTFEREDHVFLRALDFYGANPAVCLDITGAAAIVGALNELLKLRQQSTVSRGRL